jgi:hypothetical protein
MIVMLPLIPEADYPALTILCDSEVTGTNFSDYLEKLAERRDGFQALGIEVTMAEINLDAFSRVFKRRRKATWADLMTYARMHEIGTVVRRDGGDQHRHENEH